MHGSTRLPSRGGQRRGIAANNDAATARAALFTFHSSAHSSNSVRLPSLTPSVVTPLVAPPSSSELKEAAVHAARLRYTSSLKRKTRSALKDTASTSSNPSSRPPTLGSVEPVRSSAAEKRTSSASPSPQCCVIESGATPRSSSSLETLMKNQQYAELYFVLSTLLPITSRRLLKDDAHTLRILGYRAICSCALLRYKESAEDGMACLDIRRRLHEVGCAVSSGDDQRLSVQVDECVMRALVMGERYEEADKVASFLLSTSSPPFCGAGGEHLAADGPTTSMWQSAIPHIKRFRGAVVAHQWRDALAVIDSEESGTSDARACLRASPLCAMLAFVHLESGHPMTARALLLAYLADLPEPPMWEVMLTAPSEHGQLWDSFRSHYVFATTLLAKASVMSGSAYLNIAAALLQRCLRVLPLYTPARLLAEFVLSYEAQQELLETAVSAQDFPAALHLSARMLAMPEVNPALQAEVYLARTQIQWLRCLPLEVVREASQCVAADPACALALRLRADALEAMDQGAEAVADRAAARHLNANVEAAYAQLQAQRQRYDAAQRVAASQRRSFTAFAAAAPTASHRPDHLWGASDSGTHTSPHAADAGFRCARAKTDSEDPPSPSPLQTSAACSEPTHYAILGVPRHATLSEIRQRYRHLILQCHPDRLVNASAESRQQAAEEFKRVSNAYSVLSDAEQRRDYDATVHPFI